MSTETIDLGFDRTASVIEEYRSSININPMHLDIGQIAPDAARNLAYRADKLVEQKGWEKKSTSYVLTLTVAQGENRHSVMSLNQQRQTSNYPAENENQTVVDIHPLDLVELMNTKTARISDPSRPDNGSWTARIDGVYYKRNADTPRTPGEHFIF